MRDDASRSSLMGATEEMLARVGPDMRDLLRELLLHKSVFVGESFVALAARDDVQEVRIFRRVLDETVAQGVETSRTLEEWDRLPHDRERVEALATDVRRNLIHALIVMKELSTEAFLATAMAAPTKGLRDEITRLADLDRQHADDLRAVVGASTVRDRMRREEALEADAYGAHGGQLLAGTLGRRVQRTLEMLRGKQAEPIRLVVSPLALRHLRDEGHLQHHLGFGLPVDVELGWIGEAFAVTTRDRVSLAEVLTAQATDTGP